MHLPRIPNRTRKDPLEPKGRKGIQAAHQGTHRQELGRFDGVPPEKTARVYARLDRILRHQRVLQAYSAARPVDTPPVADVLLEDVEAPTTTKEATAQARPRREVDQHGRQ